MHSSAHPMTQGSILRHLIRFAVPTVLGDLFQVTYNTVDSVIVGRHAGSQALAAVGIASPVMSIAMFFIIGMGIGASVLMSEFFGAGDVRRLRREFSTLVASALAVSAIIAITLFALATPLLRLCRTREELLKDTSDYLRIIALGVVASSMYSILAAALRSIGNTRTPLLCLIAGSTVNVGLDLWFVAGLDWGVTGAAVATVISQAVSALLCAYLLWRGSRELFIAREDLVVDKALLGRTVSVSYASALQQAGIYVGKLLVQTQVNGLAPEAIAAFTAVNRIDDYAIIPQRDIGNGETVCIAQNRGARQPDRMRQGLRTAMLIEIVYSLAISLVIFFLAEPLLRLFVKPEEKNVEEVVRLGTKYLRLMGFFYVMPGITNGLQGFMRAMGKMKLTMYVTYSQMLTRALFTFILIRRMDLDAVPLACVAGWTLMMIWEFGVMASWKKKGMLYRVD